MYSLVFRCSCGLVVVARGRIFVDPLFGSSVVDVENGKDGKSILAMGFRTCCGDEWSCVLIPRCNGSVSMICGGVYSIDASFHLLVGN